MEYSESKNERETVRTNPQAVSSDSALNEAAQAERANTDILNMDSQNTKTKVAETEDNDLKQQGTKAGQAHIQTIHVSQNTDHQNLKI